MDLLFKRYASPFLLLDQFILCGQFEDFVPELIELDDHDRLWEVWLNKTTFDGRSFIQWKEDVLHPQGETVSEQELKATITKSFNIIKGFTPSERG